MAVAKEEGWDPVRGLVWPVAVEDVGVLGGDGAVGDSGGGSIPIPSRPQGLLDLDGDGVVLLMFYVTDGAVAPMTLLSAALAPHVNHVVFVVIFD